MILERNNFKERITEAFKAHPVVAILGPRQCGKTTLAKSYASSFSESIIFDLENDRDLAKLHDPLLTLENLKGLVILDEIQRIPELFKTLRVLVDQSGRKQKFLILGSASRDLIRQSSETLAGRIQYLELTPFSFQEVDDSKKLWFRGGFPLSYLAKDIKISNTWRRSYISTFLERDIPDLGFRISSTALSRFWKMLAHYHANIFNASELGRSFGVAHTTVNHYLDILTETFMVRRLQPWFENIKKRQVKSPKIYIRDSGILHSLLNVESFDDLMGHPKMGASWEGFALEEIIRQYETDTREYYFWATHMGAELDLLLINHNHRIGFEFKYTSAPKITKSMKIALETLKLDKLFIIIPGHESFPLHKKIIAAGLKNYLNEQY